jgi:hypothetical protein
MLGVVFQTSSKRGGHMSVAITAATVAAAMEQALKVPLGPSTDVYWLWTSQ